MKTKPIPAKGSATELFVVGVGRSGTSLLQTMLAAHPEIEFLPETAFVRRLFVTKRLSKALRESGANSTLKLLKNDPKLQRIQSLESALEGIDLSDPCPERVVLNSLFRSICTTATRVVGDKDPRNIELLEVISKTWPNAQIIHVFRDPRDVLLSKKKAQWSRNRKSWWHLMAGATQFAAAMKFKARVGSDRILDVKYERLLEEPEAELNRACQFLGIEYHAAMLHFRESAESLVAQDESEWKKELFGPLLTDNKGKWAKELSPAEIRLTEIACSQVMRYGSYPRADRRVALLDYPRLFVQLMLIRGVSLLVGWTTAWRCRSIVKSKH